jgi:hypothetical protein
VTEQEQKQYVDEQNVPRRYDQGTFRKNFLRHHESEKEAEHRRLRVQYAVKQGREDDTLPKLDLHRSGDSEGKISAIAIESNMNSFQGANRSREESRGNDTHRGGAMNGIDGKDSSRDVFGRIDTTRNSSRGSDIHRADSRGTEKGKEDAKDVEMTKGDLTTTDPTSPSVRRSTSHMTHQESGPTVTGLHPTVDMKHVGEMITKLFEAKGSSPSPQDMIQLGMGMGMALFQSGMIQTQQNDLRSSQRTSSSTDARNSSDEETAVVLAKPDYHTQSMFPVVTDDLPLVSYNSADTMPPSKEPIGLAYPSETFSINKALDHEEYDEQQQRVDYALRNESVLTPLDEVKSLVVHDENNRALTFPPDEMPLKDLTAPRPMNAEEAVKEKVPILLYPELSSISVTGGPLVEVTKHRPAGVNNSDTAQSNVIANRKELRHVLVPPPTSFHAAVISKKIAKQEVDYLPKIPNLPQTRTVGALLYYSSPYRDRVMTVIPRMFRSRSSSKCSN